MKVKEIEAVRERNWVGEGQERKWVGEGSRFIEPFTAVSARMRLYLRACLRCR